MSRLPLSLFEFVPVNSLTSATVTAVSVAVGSSDSGGVVEQPARTNAVTPTPAATPSARMRHVVLSDTVSPPVQGNARESGHEPDGRADGKTISTGCEMVKTIGENVTEP